jgi:hypothetical protein
VQRCCGRECFETAHSLSLVLWRRHLSQGNQQLGKWRFLCQGRLWGFLDDIHPTDDSSLGLEIRHARMHRVEIVSGTLDSSCQPTGPFYLVIQHEWGFWSGRIVSYSFYSFT